MLIDPPGPAPKAVAAPSNDTPADKSASRRVERLLEFMMKTSLKQEPYYLDGKADIRPYLNATRSLFSHQTKVTAVQYQ
jgi:hypothetical protein